MLFRSAPIVEKTKGEKKKNVADQRVLNKPCNQSVVKSVARAKSLHDRKEVLE